MSEEHQRSTRWRGGKLTELLRWRKTHRGEKWAWSRELPHDAQLTDKLTPTTEKRSCRDTCWDLSTAVVSRGGRHCLLMFPQDINSRCAVREAFCDQVKNDSFRWNEWSIKIMPALHSALYHCQFCLLLQLLFFSSLQSFSTSQGHFPFSPCLILPLHSESPAVLSLPFLSLYLGHARFNCTLITWIVKQGLGRLKDLSSTVWGKLSLAAFNLFLRTDQ